MKNKSQNSATKKQKSYDKGQIFVKIMAGLLAVLMLGGTAVSLVYALIR